jgi:hypothetical protein
MVDQEGRDFHENWPVHAAQYVKLIRFALATYPDDSDLAAIVSEVRADADVRRIWEETAVAAEHCHGHVYNMTVPAVGPSPIPLLGHLTYPADMPGCRLVVLTPPAPKLN